MTKYEVTYTIRHNQISITSTSVFKARDEEQAEFILIQLFNYKSLKIHNIKVL